MTHSGINAYLTLHIAQILMRSGEKRYYALVQRVAELASPTGQWPEAIHPQTGGGCMGDGQHVWAAAEWIMIIRNGFVREEPDCLVIGVGICDEWLSNQQTLYFGPAPTTFGDITMSIIPLPSNKHVVSTQHRISWQGKWHDNKPAIEVRLPGRATLFPKPGEASVLCDTQCNAK
jgi:hypothetical protein